MNALVIRKAGDGIDIDLKTDPSDEAACLFVKWLYAQILLAEKNCPEPETP